MAVETTDAPVAGVSEATAWERGNATLPLGAAVGDLVQPDGRGTQRPRTMPPGARESERSGTVETVHAEAPASETQESGADGELDAKTRSWFSDLIMLSKPRIVVMIVITAAASGAIAGGSIGAFAWLCLLVGTGLVAASAGAANQIWERVIDGQMNRTARRPLPAGRMKTAPAVVACVASGLIGTGLLGATVGLMPGLVGVTTWALYVFVYTPMKVRTAWNTTVGAVAGALPVFMGYTACGGSLSDATGWFLFGILACWQFPHFMAIAWLYRRDYAKAGFHMTTTVRQSVQRAGRDAGWQSVAGAIGMTLASLSCMACSWGSNEDAVSGMVAGIAVVLVLVSGWPLLGVARKFLNQPDDKTARKMLRWSLVVLPIHLLLVTVSFII
ncbi:MAG: protoheme IX farnesyltransferase [Planctomycetota bacterium]